MPELLLVVAIIAAVGVGACVFLGLLVGISLAAVLSILFVVLAVLGLIGKILLLPFTIAAWTFGHPLMLLLLIAGAVMLLRRRPGARYARF